MADKLVVTMSDLNTTRYSSLIEARELLEISGLKWDKLDIVIEDVKSLAKITNPNWMGWYDRDELETMSERGEVEFDLSGADELLSEGD